MTEDQLACQTSPSNVSTELPVTIKYGEQERRLEGSLFRYTLDPNITFAEPPKSFLRYKESVPSPGQCAGSAAPMASEWHFGVKLGL